MTSDDRRDRRQSPRVHSIHLVTLEPEGPIEGAPVEVGRTLDVSGTGLRVETGTAIPPGRRVRLEIAVGESVIEASGRAIHVEASATQGLHTVGIEFLDLDPLSRAVLLDDLER